MLLSAVVRIAHAVATCTRRAITVGLLALGIGCTRYSPSGRDPFDYTPAPLTPKQAVAYFSDFVERNDSRAAGLYLLKRHQNDSDELLDNLVLWELTLGRLFKRNLEQQTTAGKIAASPGMHVPIPMLTDEALVDARARLAHADARPTENSNVVVIDLTPERYDGRQPPLLLNLLEQKIVVRLNRNLWQIDVSATFPQIRTRLPLSARTGAVAERLRQYEAVREISASIAAGRFKQADEVKQCLRTIFPPVTTSGIKQKRDDAVPPQ